MYSYGIRNYFFSTNNILNVCMYTLFTVSFGLKYYTMIIVTIEKNKLSDTTFWRKIRYMQESDINSQIEVFTVFYWLNDG